MQRTVAQVVGSIDGAAERLADPSNPLRQTAERALPVLTGYSAPMIAHVLDGMITDWRSDRLNELLEAEFSDTRVLDEYRPRGAAPGCERAFSPELILHIFSGNVPGVGVMSLIRGLLVKSASLAKTSAGEPLLGALFAGALAHDDPELGDCIAVTYWPGAANRLETAALAGVDYAIVYGADETISALRDRAPAGLPIRGFGHRLSFAVVLRDALTEQAASSTALEAARQVATFDQQGCVSPHLVYVESGGDVAPAEWAALLAGELARIERVWPRGGVAPGEATEIRRARTDAEFRELAGSGVVLHASEPDTAWTVIFDPDPAFQPSCLNRLVRVKPIGDRLDIVPHLGPAARHLQSIGYAGDPRRVMDLAEALGQLGASRITPLAEMAWPRASWHHDGHPPLRELVRWCDFHG